MGKIRAQEVTVVPATVLGGSGSLKGKFLLADVNQVQDEQFWNEHCGRVGVIISCLRDDHRIYYPRQGRATEVQQLVVDLRSPQFRKRDFETALPYVRDVLESGQDVLVHCRESFHRGPMCVAMLMRALTGTDYQVVLFRNVRL